MMFFKIKTAYPEYKPLFSFLLVRDFIAGSESHKQKKSSQDLHFSFFFKWFLMPKITNVQPIYAFFCRLNSLINRKKCLFTKLGFVIKLRHLRDKRIHFCCNSYMLVHNTQFSAIYNKPKIYFF